MPEEINQAVADLWCSPCSCARGRMAAEFGIEFDAVMAIEPLGFLEFLQPAKGLALTGSGAGPGYLRCWKIYEVEIEQAWI